MSKQDSEPAGDCFIVAVDLVFNPNTDLEIGPEQRVHIVHGTPIGQGEENRGQRFWHAWVEVATEFRHPDWDHAVTIETVIDRANNKDFWIPKAVYYNAGQIEEEHVWRFTEDEAEHAMRTFGHYGPWVDDWEEVCPL